MPAPPEDLPVTHHSTVYPGIEPSNFVGSLNGKVVFITGASRGIGEATAVAFAQSGANLFLASRNQATLDSVTDNVLQAVPSVKIGTHPTDVVNHESVRDAMMSCIAQFGRVDVVISNAGASEIFGETIAERSPAIWWNTWEVNLLGSFNVAHYALPELAKTRGYLMLVGSAGAQRRVVGASSYQASKHALNRVAEFAAMESAPDGVKVFAVHPGGVQTELSKAAGPGLRHLLKDDVRLAGWTMVRLVQGNDDYLSGRYVSSNWDLDEVRDKWKDAIIEEDALKNRLALPTGAQV